MSPKCSEIKVDFSDIFPNIDGRNFRSVAKFFIFELDLYVDPSLKNGTQNSFTRQYTHPNTKISSMDSTRRFPLKRLSIYESSEQSFTQEPQIRLPNTIQIQESTYFSK